MKTMKHTKSFAKLVILVSLVPFMTSCSTSSLASSQTNEVFYEKSGYQEQIPGVVEYVWEEPMVDVIEVPPGLDPEGIYWMPSHEEVVEIRQGRWKYYGPPK